MPACNDKPDVIVGRDAEGHKYWGVETTTVNARELWDCNFSDLEKVLKQAFDNAQESPLKRFCIWRKPPWHRRLWRWVTGLWRRG